MGHLDLARPHLARAQAPGAPMKPAHSAKTAGPAPQGWELDELVRRRRLREHARRPLGVNLAEGIALSEFLSSFTGAARR